MVNSVVMVGRFHENALDEPMLRLETPWKDEQFFRLDWPDTIKRPAHNALTGVQGRMAPDGLITVTNVRLLSSKV